MQVLNCRLSVLISYANTYQVNIKKPRDLAILKTMRYLYSVVIQLLIKLFHPASNTAMEATIYLLISSLFDGLFSILNKNNMQIK